MIQIITDTTSGLTIPQAEQLGIPLLPQIVIIGDESYRDDNEIDTSTFLKKMKQSPVLPKTAAPPPQLYYPYYQKFQDEGHQILVLTPSADVSGTYRSAQVAAQEFPQARITIIDTRSISAGLGTLVLLAKEWADNGESLETIVEKIKQLMMRSRIYFLVDTLEYLHKGGRIGAARALVGSILQVKPILVFKNGVIEAFENKRTKRLALARFKEVIRTCYPKNKPGYLAVMHGEAAEEANILAENLASEFGVPIPPIYEMPPAILVHSGPGILAASLFIE